MDIILSTILISIPFCITVIIATLQFFVIFSNRISKEFFYLIRRKLAITRLIFNLIAIAGNIILGLNTIAIILTIITLNLVGIDIAFYIFENITTGNKR